MAQGDFGRLTIVEDFTSALAQTLTDATEYQFNQIRLAAVSGNVAMDVVVDEGNGVATFSGAAGAGDGIGIFTLPMIPLYNGPLVWEARVKHSAVTDLRVFMGFQETLALAEPVNPFTLNGTTLTANNTGNTFGIYYDTQATTDDFRAMVSVDGVAGTTAINNDTGSAFGSLGVRASSGLVADSWWYARIELDPDGAARAYYGDITTDPNNTGPKRVCELRAGTLDTTAAYHPSLLLLEQSTGDPLHHVDFVSLKYGRDWRYRTP